MGEPLRRRADQAEVGGGSGAAGCNLGPRQQKAWDMVAEAHGWNAISDDPELVAQAEQHEADGVSYRVGYGQDGFGITVPQPQAEAAEVRTETVPTSQLGVGDVVATHGMRVRIDAVNEYASSQGGTPAWFCPGTVLNLSEVLGAGIVPSRSS